MLRRAAGRVFRVATSSQSHHHHLIIRAPLSTLSHHKRKNGNHNSKRKGWRHGETLAAGAAAAVAGGIALCDEHTDGHTNTPLPTPGTPQYQSESVETKVAQGDDFDVAEYKLARQNTTRKVKNHYQYVIIGAGTTAYAAIETIFNHQPDADILIVSDEAALPQPDVFRHHSLSAQLLHSYNEWRRHTTSKLESEPDAYSSAPMTVLLNKEKDLQLDPDKHRILLEDGSYITYDKCLIATAGRPRGLWAVDRRKMSYKLRDRINVCSTIYDFDQLDNLHNTMANKHVTVVGGGFLGTELALALSVRGRESGMTVSHVYAEKAPLSRYIPTYLALHVQRLMHSAGVLCVSERLVTDFKDGDDENGALRMSLMGWNKESVFTDYAVLAPTHVDPCVDVAVKSGLEVDSNTGGILANQKLKTINRSPTYLPTYLPTTAPTHVDPCVDVAVKSGLEVDSNTGGIVVNQQLEAISNVFVAGGVASYYDPALGRRRVEMFDHSINSGILAGKNMVADELRCKKRYTHQPMYRSNLKDVDVVIDVVGEISAKMQTVGIWVTTKRDSNEEDLDYQRGIVYYLEDSRIKGILLWNASDYLERAREVLRFQPSVKGVDTLKRQIALAPDSWLRVMETEADYRE